MAIERVENYITFPLIENVREQERSEAAESTEEISKETKAHETRDAETTDGKQYLNFKEET